MYFLPLDQRVPWPPYAVAAAKQAIYEGFREAALDPRIGVGIIADEASGVAILRDASARGIPTTCAIGGNHHLAADVREAAARARASGAHDWMITVDYNPDGHPGADAAQAARARQLCEEARRSPGVGVMCDLIVPPMAGQIAYGVRAFDCDLLPGLTTRAVAELVSRGVDPDAWAIQGLETREDYLPLLRAAAGGGRHTGVVVRAAGHGDRTTRQLMGVGLSVTGVIGVILSRVVFWEPAAAWMSGRTTRATAVAAVASLFRQWATLPAAERRVS